MDAFNEEYIVNSNQELKDKLDEIENNKAYEIHNVCIIKIILWEKEKTHEPKTTKSI